MGSLSVFLALHRLGRSSVVGPILGMWFIDVEVYLLYDFVVNLEREMTILRDSSSSGDNNIPLVILRLANRVSIKEFLMLSSMTCCEIKVLVVDEDIRDLLLKFCKKKKKRAHKTHKFFVVRQSLLGVGLRF